MIGALMLLVLLVLCLLTPYIARYDPIKQNYRAMLQTPSAKHYFGTDRYGRDIWSRILWGGRRFLLISLLAVVVGVLVGIPMGTLSGYCGGGDVWCRHARGGRRPGVLGHLLHL